GGNCGYGAAILYFFFYLLLSGFDGTPRFVHAAFCHTVGLLDGRLALALGLRAEVIDLCRCPIGHFRSLTDTLFGCFPDGFAEFPYAVACAVHLSASLFGAQ